MVSAQKIILSNLMKYCCIRRVTDFDDLNVVKKKVVYSVLMSGKFKFVNLVNYLIKAIVMSHEVAMILVRISNLSFYFDS